MDSFTQPSVLFSLLTSLLVVSCSSNLQITDVEFAIEVVSDDTDAGKKLVSPEIRDFVDRFTRLTGTIENKTCFLFFTDPHLLKRDNLFSRADSVYLTQSFDTLRSIYGLLDVDFCLCGGDWLNDGDYRVVAENNLCFADSLMHQFFPRYYKLMGNHDFNTMGFVNEQDRRRGTLSDEFINNVYFQDVGGPYYKVNSSNTSFYFLDSGCEYEMDRGRWEQLKWLASNLINDEIPNIVIGMHMYWRGASTDNHPMPFSDQVIRVCAAFNKKEIIDIDGTEYDFSLGNGKILFIVTGHNHIDYYVEPQGIPVIGVTRFVYKGTSSFDAFAIDYDNMRLHTVRFGNGKDRVFELN